MSGMCAHTVTTGRGQVFAYDKLVLALGSHAFIPPIAGADLAGVYAFRNFDDAEKLVGRVRRKRLSEYCCIPSTALLIELIRTLTAPPCTIYFWKDM